METLTLEQAVERAIKNNPTVAQASQDILRAEGLLQQARAATMPFITAGMSTLVNSTERRFDDVVTSPQTQATLSAQFGMPVLAPSRWAAKAQAQDQVEIANLSTADVRTGIAVSTAQAYLAIIALKREVEVTQRALDTSLAHLDYARRRLEAGAGTRVNELRAGQEVSTNEARLETAQLGVRRAQEALGVLIVSDGPADTAGDPVFVIPPIADEAGWMALRPDVRLFTAEERAADRVWKDSSKDWFPTAIATFDPQAIVPASIFTSPRSWRFVVNVYTADLRQRRAERAEARARSQLQRLAAGADRTADSGAIGSAIGAGNRAPLGARTRRPAFGRRPGERSAEDHDVRLRSRRYDKPRSDRRAASGARCGYGGSPGRARGAQVSARSAHSARAVPTVELLSHRHVADDASESFKKFLRRVDRDRRDEEFLEKISLRRSVVAVRHRVRA